MTEANSTVAPLAFRGAGAVVVLQGSAGIVAAVVLVIRAASASQEYSMISYSMAVLFAVIGAALMAAGVALIRSQRGGRGPAVVVQIVLLPVAWSLLTSSGQIVAGVLVGAIALITLALMLTSASRRWMREQYEASVEKGADAERDEPS